MEKYLGIDLGGTNVRVAKVLENGEIIEDIKRPSLAEKGKEAVVSNIIEMLKSIKDYKECQGIGIGVPGPVDTKRNVMTMSSNLPGFAFYNFADTLSDIFKMPVYLDNDANAAGLAEALVGAGKGHSIVYYITHSTGIGGALVIDGKVLSGKNGYAGEIGNLIIDRDRQKYNHLNAGAVETEAGGLAIARIGKEILGDKIQSAKDVIDLAYSGDSKALKIIDDMAYDLAVAMSYIGHVVDPDIFVIGGGIANADDLYFGKLADYYRSLVHDGMKDVLIKKAILKEPGITGAALLTKSRR